MVAQWPRVQARLVALLPTLPGWDSVTVFDMAPLSGSAPLQYASVGYVSDENSGTYQSTQALDGYQYVEQGTVPVHVVCQTGGDDLPGMRAQLFALTDALDAAIRADRTLGVLSQDGTTDLSVDVNNLSNQNGTALSAVLSINYYTVT